VSAVRRVGRWLWPEYDKALILFSRLLGIACSVATVVYAYWALTGTSWWVWLWVPYWAFLAWFNLRQARKAVRNAARHHEFMTEIAHINGMIEEYNHLTSREARWQQTKDIEAALAAAKVPEYD
jgi:hypothetical protein